MTDLRQLYERYSRDVHRFAVGLSGDPALADDITAETFLRAWTSRTPIREGTVKAYLFTIARNVYLHELRRRRRQVEIPADIASREPSQHERAEHANALQAVLSALRQLPEVDRAALLMHTQQDMSYDEIARAVGVSVAALRVRIHRARLKLAALVQKEVVL